MLSSSTNQQHVSNFTNESAVYSFRLYDGGDSWTDISSKKTIQWALDNYEWDLITSIGLGIPYQPYMNQIINLVTDYVDYPIKWGVHQAYVRPAVNNTTVVPDTTSKTIEQIDSDYESMFEKTQNLMDTSICDFIVPCAAAIKNACTIPSIMKLGDFSQFANNNLPIIDSVHAGYLAYSDGVHC